MEIMENAFIQGPLPLLSIMVALPMVAALIISLPGVRTVARPAALLVSLVELGLAVAAAITFDWSQVTTYQIGESYAWIPMLGVTWSLAVNALGLVMILLATSLVPLVIVAGWKDDTSPSGYLALVLALETFMVAIFAAYDVVLFYFAFEAMLIPLYFMVGKYGVGDQEARSNASMKLLLFSLAGGLSMLAGLVYMWQVNAQFNYPTYYRYDTLTALWPLVGVEHQVFVFVTFMIAFAIKAPMVPVHTWLPDTAAVARPGTSTLLVAVLDKIGTYGMIMLVLPLFPAASAYAAPVMCILAIISILWGALAAIGQDDMMRLVSYTSVSHFGFMVLGIFVGNSIAFTGAMVYMVAHGVSIAAMFLISGFLTERGATRDMRHYGGMQRVTPVLAGTWLMAGLASVALPGLSGFVPEYLVLMGTWSAVPAYAAVAVLGVVLAAVYLLLPYQRVFIGQPRAAVEGLNDLCGREKLVIAPLLIAMVILGVWAAPLVSSLAPIAHDGTAVIVTGAASEGMAK